MSEIYSQPDETMETAEKIALAGVTSVIALATVGAIKVAKWGFDAYQALLREEDEGLADLANLNGGNHA